MDKSPSSQDQVNDTTAEQQTDKPVSAASQPTPPESLKPVTAADTKRPSAEATPAPAKYNPEQPVMPDEKLSKAAPDAKSNDAKPEPAKAPAAAAKPTEAKPSTLTGALRASAQKGDSSQQGVLAWLRDRLTMLSDEYAAGNLNAPQFNALYRHYSEKRILVERLIERDPDSKAWQAAAQPGFTQNLRDRFQSRPKYYVVFKRGRAEPLIASGKLPEEVAREVLKFSRAIWRLPSWKKGLARKQLSDGYWMMLVTGDTTFTMAVYFMEPSGNQGIELSNMHTDFERANEGPLARNMPPDRLVFPQRALLEQ
ncbi:MAG: hypothetical protein CL607_27455 [Anaerolineaceae bacterium]|nr:hypothetical protein [Anaerolineaceae bacterium]